MGDLKRGKLVPISEQGFGLQAEILETRKALREVLVTHTSELERVLEEMKLDGANALLEDPDKWFGEIEEHYKKMAALCLYGGIKDDALVVWGRELKALCGWGPKPRAKGKKGESAAEFQDALQRARAKAPSKNEEGAA